MPLAGDGRGRAGPSPPEAPAPQRSPLSHRWRDASSPATRAPGGGRAFPNAPFENPADSRNSSHSPTGKDTTRRHLPPAKETDLLRNRLLHNPLSQLTLTAPPTGEPLGCCSHLLTIIPSQSPAAVQPPANFPSCPCRKLPLPCRISMITNIARGEREQHGPGGS